MNISYSLIVFNYITDFYFPFSRKEEIDKAFFNQVTTDPQREFFGFNTKTEKIINKSFEKFVKDELRKFKL